MLKISNITITSKLKKVALFVISGVLVVSGVTGLFIYKKHIEDAKAATACQRVLRGLSQDVTSGVSRNKSAYQTVSSQTNVPWELLAAIHYRETAFGRKNPANGQGIFQFVNGEGGPYPYTGNEVSETEFRRQLKFMANTLQNDYVNRTNLNYPKRKLKKTETDAYRVKDVLFSYNGRAGVYANQATKYGYSKASSPYEGSPYVMNMFDCPRGTMGIITQDYGGIDGKDTRYGAFTIYARLKGDTYWKSLQTDKVSQAKFERLVGPSGGSVLTSTGNHADYTSTTQVGNEIHTFFSDIDSGQLKHAWFVPGSDWRVEVVDGIASSQKPGSVSNDVGRYVDSMYDSTSKRIEVFYYDNTQKRLRNASYNRTTKKWSYQVIDGSTSAVAANAINANVGAGVSAVKWYGDIQVFYRDSTNGALRHAWKRGGVWRSETADGTSNSLSKATSNTGHDVQVIKWYKHIQVLYYDSTQGALRHAWWNGKKWSFEYMEGTSNSISKATGDIGKEPAFTTYNGGLQMFYNDRTNQSLRHGWWNGKKWSFEQLDGTTGSVLGYASNLGQRPDVVVSGRDIYVFYFDNSRTTWRLAKFTPTQKWIGYDLDGSSTSVSGKANRVHGQLSASRYSSHGTIQVFYKDDTTAQGLRHGWLRF